MRSFSVLSLNHEAERSNRSHALYPEVVGADRRVCCR
jgi:hypothetical protein